MFPPKTTLAVYDFDDTLVWQGGTSAKVRIHTYHPGVETPTTRRVSWGSYWDNLHGRLSSNQTADFTELDPHDLLEIKWSVRSLRHYVRDPTARVVILTARANPAPVHRFLHQARLSDDVEVVALGAPTDPGPEKARWLLEQGKSYNLVKVYEDRVATLEVIQEVVVPVLTKLYGVRVSTHHVGPDHRRAHGLRRRQRHHHHSTTTSHNSSDPGTSSCH